MPSPVYILCCESGAEDKESGRASHFNIIDRIELRVAHVQKSETEKVLIISTMPFRIIAVWQATEERDFEAEVESEMRVFLPPDNKEWIVHSEPFRFLREKPRQRFTIAIQGLAFQGPGRLLAESRIRRSGDPDWMTMTYLVEIVAMT